MANNPLFNQAIAELEATSASAQVTLAAFKEMCWSDETTDITDPEDSSKTVPSFAKQIDTLFKNMTVDFQAGVTLVENAQDNFDRIATARTYNTALSDTQFLNEGVSTGEHYWLEESATWFWYNPVAGNITDQGLNSDGFKVITVGGNDYTLFPAGYMVPWEYTPVGGETEIDLPTGVTNVKMVTLNGVVQTPTKAWIADIPNGKLTIAEGITSRDRLIVYIAGGWDSIISISNENQLLEAIAIKHNADTSDILIYKNAVTTIKPILYFPTLSLTITNWDDIAGTETITGLPTKNSFGGWDIPTSDGVKEYVTLNTLTLRTGGMGWLVSSFRVTNTAGWGHDGTNLPVVIDKIKAYAKSKNIVVTVWVDKDSVLSSTLTIDTAMMNVNFNYATVDCSGMTGTSVLVDASNKNAAAYPNSNVGFCNAVFVGNRVDGNTCLLFNSDEGGSSTRCHVDRVVIHNFGIGVDYGAHAYGVMHTSCAVYSCNLCVRDLGGKDSGENIFWDKSFLFNSTLAVSAKNVNGELKFDGCSIDYNGKIFDIDGSMVFFTNGHLEDNSTNIRTTITGNGGSLFVSDSSVLRGASSPVDTHYLTVDEGCVASFSNCFFNNLSTTSGEFYSGDGTCIFSGSNGFDINSNTVISGKSASLLAYPTFDALSSEVCVEEGITGNALTDYHNSTRYALSVDSNRLVCEKIASGQATFNILSKFDTNAILGYSVKYDTSETANDLYATLWWCKIDYDYNGRREFVRRERVNDGSHTLTAGVSDGSFKLASRTYRCPSWATHLLIRINANGQTTSSKVYLSDAYITQNG